MSNIKSLARDNCALLAVVCGNYVNRQIGERERRLSYPFPEIASAGRVEVRFFFLLVFFFNSVL